MSTKKKTDTPFVTTVRMTHRMRADIDIVRALWAERTGRRPPAHEVIVAALENFLARERAVAQRAH